jgi:2-polyprenyl-3-methyl-5-hydroxy-6-metoxy-1,4-benzoquinol methylase
MNQIGPKMNQIESTEEISTRVEREKAAHENSHIDDALRQWWAVFPHVFKNTSMRQLAALYRDELGSVQDKTILDYGCGQGDFSLWLLDQGAKVVGIDISEFNVTRCHENINTRRFLHDRYTFAVMDAHKTTFPEKFFDRIVGNGILHHLDLPAAMGEVHRLLKPGGKALFQEPLGDNPLLRLYRSIAGIHTADERPLTRNDLHYLVDQWGIKTKYSGLVTLPTAIVTSIVLRPYPDNLFLRVAVQLEELLNRRHIFDHWNRFAVLIYERKNCDHELGVT